MKWNCPRPQIGEVRRRERFAWLPVRTDDGYTVWLETYAVHEAYMEAKGGDAWCPVRVDALFPWIM